MNILMGFKLKFNWMKQVIINSLIAIFVYGFTMYINNREITKLKLENEDLKIQNNSLLGKITLIENSFDKFMDKRSFKRGAVSKKRYNSSNKTTSSKDELATIKKDILTLDNTLDSIRTTLPNRTGQDLINSLKLKTEI